MILPLLSRDVAIPNIKLTHWSCHPYASSLHKRFLVLRGTLVNRTYGGHKNLHIYLFLLTIFGPTYYRPP